MSQLTTAKEVRAANPGVEYEDQVFTTPFDIEVQALQKSVAEKFSWRIADALLSFWLIRAGFRKLGSIHAQGATQDVLVRVTSSLPVIAGLDHYIGFLVSLIADAEGKSRADVFAAFEQYAKDADALEAKYNVTRVEDDLVQTPGPSLAPQN